MSSYLVDQINAQENIEVILNTELKSFQGQDRLEAIAVENIQNNKLTHIPASAAFIFIGARARTGIVSDLVECDSSGFILTDKDLMTHGERPTRWKQKRDPYFLETSIPGIFAAGDVRKSSVKMVAAAVGQGAIAIALVHQYLKDV